MSSVVSVVLVAAVLLALVGALYQRAGARRDRVRYPAPGVLVDAGGVRLHARCDGSGWPPVIFEAGVAASSVSWSLVQPAVARETRTCSYDRAGLAWSDPSRARPTLETLVAELHALARALALESPYVLVGHSFGSFVVRAYAAARPADVAGLVLVDPITTEEWSNLPPDQRRLLRGGILLSHVGAGLAGVGVVRACLTLLAGGGRRVPRGVARIFGTTTLGFLERIIGEVQKLPADVLPAVRALWCRPQSFRGMAAYLAALPACAASLTAAPAGPDIPLVVLSAANSTPERLREHAALARQSSRGAHRVAAHGGHWIHLDEPMLVVEAVREMLLSVRRAGL